MADKFWNTKNEKIFISLGMAATSYHAMSMVYPKLPTIPVLGNSFILGLAAILTAYGIWVLWSKY